MSKFDEIIGYEVIKKELRQVADILRNGEMYRHLGVKAPQGLLIHGEPGVGKTLMAAAVIESCGRPAFTCRKDQPNGDFVREIKATFDQAAQNAPSIVLLDDMDKFANGDERHPDREEYVTVQSCIDNVRDKGVFVLATANNIRCLPTSLRRAGRFDRIIEVNAPEGEDAVNIVAHYLKDKPVDGLEAATVARILDGNSCAELETIINEAGLYAGYERAEAITMEHFLTAYMSVMHNESDGVGRDDTADLCQLVDPHNPMTQVAYHEAGHALVAEALIPGCVSLVTVHGKQGNPRGFVQYCRDTSRPRLEWDQQRVMAALAGKAAVEHKFGVLDGGCRRDLASAFSGVRDMVVDLCCNGFHLYSAGMEDSEALHARQEQVIASEVEQYYRRAKAMIAANAAFLDKLAAELLFKRLLTDVDIRRIKETCPLEPAAR
ncbi:MAG: AAA family ATPase [Ruminococcaceae bacterium]|nr:AAA family ATPase [Oscillospiraceae bacterium]